jgi:hypothetical protein
MRRSARTQAAIVYGTRLSRIGAFHGGRFGLGGVQGNRRSSEVTNFEPNKLESIDGEKEVYQFHSRRPGP